MQEKDCILFVHGFASTPEKCWGKMLELLRGDERITSRYDLDKHRYATSWIKMNLLGRIPELSELGEELAGKIQSSKYRGRTLTLVGHSQGGLVIFSCFQHLLSTQRGSDLRHIRQAIFFATPFSGSTKAMSLRRMAATLFTNPQELTLRVLDLEVTKMESMVQNGVINATKDGETSWRIPLHAFGGTQDDIVVAASAHLQAIESFRPVNGDHFSIVKPGDRDDECYLEFVDLLLDPGGHANRFDIDHYETEVTVEPHERKTIHVPSETNPREVEYDNFGTIRRTVRFSPANRCGATFTIKYVTQGNGYVIGHPSHHNEVKDEDKRNAANAGTSYQFDFKPNSENTYCLKVDVYNGFGEANRKVHFHHYNNCHRRRMTYVLDLSKYVAAGYEVQSPCLFLYPDTTTHSDLCDQLDGNPIPIDSSTPNGIYRWELHEVREGVVDIIWDVSKILP